MKRTQWISAVIALSLACAGTAWADRDDHREWGRGGGERGGEHRDWDRGHRDHDASWLGIPLGIVLFSQLLAHPPRYDEPAPVVYPPSYYPLAPVYVERPAPVYVAPPAPVVQSYWYYCPSRGNYYPYVRECPGAWQQVLPQPR